MKKVTNHGTNCWKIDQNSFESNSNVLRRYWRYIFIDECNDGNRENCA